jgi:uncharacterized protein (TIGR03086 family)
MADSMCRSGSAGVALSSDGEDGLTAMQMTTADLGPVTDEVKRIVSGVRDEQLTDPTPCAGTPVAGMLDHLVGLTLSFRKVAEKEPQYGAPQASAENLPDDWRSRLPEQLDALAAAWRKPEAWEGMSAAGGVEMPAGALGIVALNEVLIHGWDLAAGTGQEYRPDEAAAERCLEFGIDLEKNAPDIRNGMYGPRIDVPADAPVFDRVLGQAGRNPRWPEP